MYGMEMTTVVLNALPKEWGNFSSSIYGKKEETPFQDLWSLCKFEETRLNTKADVGSNEKNQASATMTKRKGNFGKFGPQKKKKNMVMIQFYWYQEYGDYKRYFPKINKDNKKRGGEESDITKEVEEV